MADRDSTDRMDVFRCFDSITGKPRWKVAYEAIGRLDYGNSPRAMPTLVNGRAVLLGAFGHLNCVDLATGRSIWSHELAGDLGGLRPNWGYSSSPLVVDQALIVNPGGRKASLMALDVATGKPLWSVAGGEAAYSSFILGTFGGRKQIVGYDAASLGGWAPTTGERLWKLAPPNSGDFNVGSPNVYGDKLVVATENNGTRMYGFGADGKITRTPVAQFSNLSPDIITPIIVGDSLFCRWGGELYNLSVKSNLGKQWSIPASGAENCANYFVCGQRVLEVTYSGRIQLYDLSGPKLQILGSTRVPTMEGVGSYAHPALVGSRLYIREPGRISCYDLS